MEPLSTTTPELGPEIPTTTRRIEPLVAEFAGLADAARDTALSYRADEQAKMLAQIKTETPERLRQAQQRT